MRQPGIFLLTVILTAILTLGLYIFAIACLTGCAPKVHLTPQTQTQVNQIQQDVAIEKEKATAEAERVKDEEQTTEQKVIAAARIATLRGQLNPTRHPFAATNNLVREIRPWLIGFTIAAGVLFALSFGLPGVFPAMTFLVRLRHWTFCTFVICGLALLFLPFLPTMFYVTGGAAIVLLVYELWRDKGNVKQAVDDAEQLVGFGSFPGGPPASSPAITVSPTSHPQ